MNIITGRMIIRDFTMNDINDMQDILGDAETMKNCEPAYTIEKTADFLQKFCIEKKRAVAAIHKDTAKVIGYILFNEFDDGVYEIGWFFNRAFWRQGFAYESCKAVIDYLADLNEQAQERLDTIMEQMKATEGVTEELKRTCQIEWVQRCNNIHNRAEEIVLHEMIYS